MAGRITKTLGGCAVISVAAIVCVVALVGWMVTANYVEAPVVSRKPIPADVPPAAGAPLPPVNVEAPGRTADQFTFWSEPIAAATHIPVPALNAYANATTIAAAAWPACHLNWTTLAGLGYVETRHGSYTGNLLKPAHIDEFGQVTPPIIGVPLDGSPGFARIEDTDGGEYDGDVEFDRAVGPMQFIPSSWRLYGRDANGDFVADPNNIDDAALSAANLLCAKGHDLATPEGWSAAIRSYNNSVEYLIDVRNAAANYAIGQRA
ncbi:lytic transglycosylase domain-containing protein [Corynebacterium choanae]|uniref:Transglycosylase SLT domain-containing protein n=1 Tax=Corynebacterium choanae TaxID=1862358 RepID=A0A3G6J8B9_9CORY|nr:lytic murein transglycosylase [Corynebacterium choanae]AZA13148.1 hypothetical protein CCHOA_03690 [Corynebacterium choanae]